MSGQLLKKKEEWVLAHNEELSQSEFLISLERQNYMVIVNFETWTQTLALPLSTV